MGQIVVITDDSFDDEVIKAVGPVVVDFWAEWCGPCKIIAPIIEELSEEYDGKVKFVKLDVDVNSKIAREYGIRSIPTLLFFNDGVAIEQVVGAATKSGIKKHLVKALGE